MWSTGNVRPTASASRTTARSCAPPPAAPRAAAASINSPVKVSCPPEAVTPFVAASTPLLHSGLRIPSAGNLTKSPELTFAAFEGVPLACTVATALVVAIAGTSSTSCNEAADTRLLGGGGGGSCPPAEAAVRFRDGLAPPTATELLSRVTACRPGGFPGAPFRNAACRELKEGFPAFAPEETAMILSSNNAA